MLKDSKFPVRVPVTTLQWNYMIKTLLLWNVKHFVFSYRSRCQRAATPGNGFPLPALSICM